MGLRQPTEATSILVLILLAPGVSNDGKLEEMWQLVHQNWTNPETLRLQGLRPTQNQLRERPEPRPDPRRFHDGIHQPPRNTPNGTERRESPQRQWQPRDRLSNTPALQANGRNRKLEGPGSSSQPKASPLALKGSSRRGSHAEPSYPPTSRSATRAAQLAS